MKVCAMGVKCEGVTYGLVNRHIQEMDAPLFWAGAGGAWPKENHPSFLL